MENTPELVKSFLNYKLSIQNRSIKTVEQYEIDLMLFFKYLICRKNGTPLSKEEFDNTDI